MTDDDRSTTVADLNELLARIEGISVTVIGGQAVNFWADWYADAEPELKNHGPYTSKDIDFHGSRSAAEECAAKIGGAIDYSVRKPFGSVLEAVIQYRDASGVVRTIDFVRSVEGVTTSELIGSVVPVKVDGVQCTVMNPVVCLASRGANVIRLPQHYDNEHGLRQLRASILVARAFIRTAIASGNVRLALDAAKRVFVLCRSAIGRKLFNKKGIDLLEAIPLDDMPETYRRVQHPRVVAQVRAQRSKHGPER